MPKTSLTKIGTSVGLLFVVLYIICLAWNALLADAALKTLHQQLIALTFPGFAWLSIGSFIWGAILSFIYGWVGAAIFVWLKKQCCK